MIDRELHQPARDVIARSAIARGLSSVGRRIESAGSRSRSVRAVATIAGAWHGLSRGERRRAIGLTLVTSAAIHAVLTVMHQVPAGWMWLVVPAIAFAEGIVLVVASGSDSTDHS